MNLIISYNFIQSIVALEYRTTFDTSQYKFLVATNELILYVVSWQATRSILPPLYRPFFSSVQTRRAPHRCWSWKNSTVTKAGINFSPPCNLCIHVCICKTLSLSLSRDQTRIRTRQDFHSFRMAKMFSMKNSKISWLCITWHCLFCLSAGKRYLVVRSIVIPSGGNTMRGAGGRVYYKIIHRIVYRSVGQTAMDLYEIIGDWSLYKTSRLE